MNFIDKPTGDAEFWTHLKIRPSFYCALVCEYIVL